MNSRNSQSTIFVLTYGEQLPSYRHRLAGRRDALEAAGWRYAVAVVPARNYVRRIVALRDQLHSADVVVISKLKLNAVECWLLRRWSTRIVYDIDDAIWLKRPRSIGEAPGQSRWRDMKFDAVCRIADHITAGNQTLAERVRPINPHITVVPTPVDVEAYQQVESAPDPEFVTAVWIGLPNNLVFLEHIRPALVTVASQYSNFRLRVVSSRSLDWEDVPIEFVQWSTEAELAALCSADIGLMPLFDDDWSRGKCAFKLLQYMAAGLPCVASPVGANTEAVIDAETGYLALDEAQWVDALLTLAGDGSKRSFMGHHGQQHAKTNYDTLVVDRQWCAILGELSE